jgi:membrane protease YdiL (CAAX protease family)
MANQTDQNWSFWFYILFLALLVGGGSYFLYAVVNEGVQSVLGGVFYIMFAIGATILIWQAGKEIPADKINYTGMLIIGVIYFFILITGALITGLDKWIPQLRSPVPITVGSQITITLSPVVMDFLYAFALVGISEEVTKYMFIVVMERLPLTIRNATSSRIFGVKVNWVAVILGSLTWAAAHLWMSNLLSYFLALLFVGVATMILYYWAISISADALVFCALIHGLWDAIIIVILATG